jgi:hypothetical protein
MPKDGNRLVRSVGHLKFDPNSFGLVLELPKSKGAQTNRFLRRLREEIRKHRLFRPCSKDIEEMFGTNLQGMHKLYKQAISAEYNAHLTPAQRAGLAKGQANIRNLAALNPRLTGSQRASLAKLKKTQTALNRARVGAQKSGIIKNIPKIDVRRGVAPKRTPTNQPPGNKRQRSNAPFQDNNLINF